MTEDAASRRPARPDGTRLQLERGSKAKALRIASIPAAVLASLVVVLVTSGFLYLVGPHAGFLGPRIGDALPLDELPGKAGVALVAFVAAWAGAGLLLGLLARILRLERLAAAVVLALAVWAWLDLATGMSLLVVRQVSTHDAFHAAHNVKAVYVAAALAGLGGALLGRPRGATGSRVPGILAALVAAAGLLDVVSAITPELHARIDLIDDLAPHAVPPLASALAPSFGLGLIVVARGLARRKRRAWQLAVILLAGSVVLHLLKGLDYEEAAATALVTLALVARRRDFDAPGDPEARTRIAQRALLYAGAIVLYGIVALWVNRALADRPYSLGFALHETGRALLGLTIGGSGEVSGSFGAWFPLSVLVLELVAALTILLSWLRPWRYRVGEDIGERGRARRLVASFGSDTLAPFALRADKSYFFASDGQALVAYRVVGGVAIVSGDPVGDPVVFDGLLASFLGHAHARDWRVAILGASDRHLDLYRRHGLRALYHGDEAVVDTTAFSLEGRPIRKVRQSVSRLTSAGYAAEVRFARDIGAALREELEQVARLWRGDEPQRGFSMELDTLFRLDADDALFVIGRGPDGTPEGLLHFAVTRPGSALSLSSMPRLRTTPNGFNEWLVVTAIDWARENGFTRVSLNFAPFAALLSPGAELTRCQRLERRALLKLKGHFQLDNLLLFNRKFFPGWQRRFVVYERRRDLPRVGIAALAAEAYLPFADRFRR